MFLLFSLLACVPEEEPPADPCTGGPAPELAIGTGEYEYAGLDSVDAELELIHGPQGGYHVLIGFDARYMDTSDPSSAEILGWIDGDPIGDAYPWIDWRCNAAAETQQIWGLFLIWDAEPEDLHGRTAEIETTVTDSAGQVSTASATITITDPNLE